MLYKFFFLQVLLMTISSAAAQKDTIDGNPKNKSNFYLAGQYFNANRSFEDLSTGKTFDSLSIQESIRTSGLEIGTSIDFSENLFLSVGINYFAGGESWQYSDTLSDSTFMYENKYRQVALPIRLNLQFGSKFKWYGFIGIIPSSILGRRYESSYANADGTVTENDIIIDQDNINAFQFIGTAGMGVSYRFGDVKVFTHVEYRQHFTNTYNGLFLNHYQKLLGGTVGLSFIF